MNCGGAVSNQQAGCGGEGRHPKVADILYTRIAREAHKSHQGVSRRLAAIGSGGICGCGKSDYIHVYPRTPGRWFTTWANKAVSSLASDPLGNAKINPHYPMN